MIEASFSSISINQFCVFGFVQKISSSVESLDTAAEVHVHSSVCCKCHQVDKRRPWQHSREPSIIISRVHVIIMAADNSIADLSSIFTGNKPCYSSNRWRHITMLWKAETYKDLAFLFHFWKFNTEWPCVCCKDVIQNADNRSLQTEIMETMINSDMPIIWLSIHCGII